MLEIMHNDKKFISIIEADLQYKPTCNISLPKKLISTIEAVLLFQNLRYLFVTCINIVVSSTQVVVRSLYMSRIYLESLSFSFYFIYQCQITECQITECQSTECQITECQSTECQITVVPFYRITSKLSSHGFYHRIQK